MSEINKPRDPDQYGVSLPTKGSRRSKRFSCLGRRGAIKSSNHVQQRAKGKTTMKCIVELLDELRPLKPFSFAERIRLNDLNSANGQRTDFENWLRRCAPPRRMFADLDEAYGAYIASFG
jgi:hypothetical protein